MQTEIYINASCEISHQLVYKNGNTIFENKHADIHGFLLSVYQHFSLKYPKFYKMDNLSKLGWLASEILIKESFSAEKYKPADTGVILANANASLDTDLKYTETLKTEPSPSVFVYTLPNIMIGEICIRNNFKGETALFVAELFDADFMEQYINILFNNQQMQVCIFGWVDVLKEDYNAVLFLAEKEKTPGSVLFTTENINKIFTAHHG